jgi:RND family efflux transporter MFP subunit
VSVSQVKSAVYPRTQSVAGTLRPADHAIIASKIMGTATHADFTIGQSVKAGEILMTLSAGEMEARLAQAQSTLDSLVRDLERDQSLVASGAAPAEAARALADRRRGAEAAVQEAKTLLGYTQITAPFTGVITRKFIQTGDLAQPGTPLLEVEGTSELRAEVEVPASLPLLAVGTTIKVEFAGGESAGTLAEISPSADPVTRTRLAKVSLSSDAASARSGDFVRVLWPQGNITVITVPPEAVSVFGQMERVFVVTEGRARLRLVKTAGSNAGQAIITAGLDAGETVIVGPSAALHDGQAVEIKP